MTISVDDLPPSWDLVRISDVTREVRSVDPTKVPETTFNYVDISSIDNKRLKITGSRRMLGAEAPSRAKRPIEYGDVIFSNVRTYLRNIARVADIDQPAVASTGFTVLRPNDKVLQDFLFQWVASDEFIQIVTPMQTGTHYPATSDRVVRAQHVPLPSIDEQHRIVGRLSQISECRTAATEHLARTRAILTNFRQTVLAAACSGRLTEGWRAEHPDSRTIDVDGLAGQRKQRRGRSGADFDVELPDLPKSYTLATISSVATVLDYGTSRKADAGPEGVSVLRMGNIQDGTIDLSDLKYMTVDNEVNRLMLQDGDLLFNRTNSPELVGKSAVWRGSDPATFASYLIRVRFHNQAAIPEFVNYWISSAWGRIWARQVKTDGVSQSNINGTKLGAMPIPLPPLDEQREIVRRVETALRANEQILARVGVTSGLLDSLGQAVLAKAFRGELLRAME